MTYFNLRKVTFPLMTYSEDRPTDLTLERFKELFKAQSEFAPKRADKLIQACLDGTLAEGSMFATEPTNPLKRYILYNGGRLVEYDCLVKLP
ncbi:hypothetical protein [Leptolyngbya sp. GGD]|uniref:hypothetical protein n=1 Tax=Leptolyngbya sp. GGD TaxID=2997907 RepID=UPI00227CA90C|nr:hypothetical protein [Leptolyngbya sp. GGD]MCY6491902.1 hypothetical protein [Leptolyngbya sp. GGD]